MTHTSMSENKGHILVKNKSIPVVDIPGKKNVCMRLMKLDMLASKLYVAAMEYLWTPFYRGLLCLVKNERNKAMSGLRAQQSDRK